MFKKLQYSCQVSLSPDSTEITATIAGDKAIIKIKTRDIFNENTKETSMPADIFLSELEKINISGWQDEYYAPVLDGESWNLKYYTTDKKVKTIYGANAYPDEYDDLMKLLYSGK
ncbi:MAG: hypothetical protein MJ147_10375 [Clostridia bacterium]|nr:hypothetical protein [Clostridia bacterium]